MGVQGIQVPHITTPQRRPRGGEGGALRARSANAEWRGQPRLGLWEDLMREHMERSNREITLAS